MQLRGSMAWHEGSIFVQIRKRHSCLKAVQLYTKTHGLASEVTLDFSSPSFLGQVPWCSVQPTHLCVSACYSVLLLPSSGSPYKLFKPPNMGINLNSVNKKLINSQSKKEIKYFI